MMNAIVRFSKRVLRPISNNIPFFVSMLTLFILPSIISDFINGSNWKGVAVMVLSTIHIYIFDAYIFNCILLILSKLKCKWGVFLYAITYITFIFDLFLILFYKRRIAPVFVRLIFETNPNEAKGFFSTLSASTLFLLILSCIVVIFCNVIIEKKLFRSNIISRLRHSIESNRIYKCGLVILSTVIIVINIVGLRKNLSFAYAYAKADYIYEMREIIADKGYHVSSITTSFGLLINAVYCTLMITSDIDVLNKTLSSSIDVSSSYRSSNIVWIIGESFNKHHSSLYGYPLLTNELLQKEVQTENLFVFSNVLTPHYTTAFVMQSIFSLKSQDDDMSWAHTPLIPKIFRDGGYRTAFFSNQEKIERQGGGFFFQIELSSNFLADENVINKCFDYSHNKIFQYDDDLIADCYNEANLQNSPCNLLIFHLSGQHFDYKDRYPESETFFSISDYAYRKELSNVQKRDIANYDNATKYNDKVITSIIDLYRNEDVIIIYTPDHGEEIHDYRNFVSRGQPVELNAQLCKYLHEVPFVVWVSDKYKEMHKDVVSQLSRAINYPFMIDDMPHFLMDLAGISCEWYDPTRSLINENYNLNRKRLLLETKYDYDAIMQSATLNN